MLPLSLWSNGRASDYRSKGREFEYRRSQCKNSRCSLVLESVTFRFPSTFKICFVTWIFFDYDVFAWGNQKLKSSTFYFFQRKLECRWIGIESNSWRAIENEAYEVKPYIKPKVLWGMDKLNYFDDDELRPQNCWKFPSTVLDGFSTSCASNKQPSIKRTGTDKPAYPKTAPTSALGEPRKWRGNTKIS